MPHCKLWGLAEWEFAFDTMELAALLHEGNAKMRARQLVLGMTAGARRDQQIGYVDPPADDAPATGVRIEDFRDL